MLELKFRTQGHPYDLLIPRSNTSELLKFILSCAFLSMYETIEAVLIHTTPFVAELKTNQ